MWHHVFLTIGSSLPGKKVKAMILLTLFGIGTACMREESPASPLPTSLKPSEKPGIEVIVEHLSIPWDIAFLPDGDLLIPERTGTLVRLGENQRRHLVSDVRGTGEAGLLGITLHPDFSEHGWIYLYRTTQMQEGLRNRVDRYRLSEDELLEATEIIAGIPGAPYHDGGRMEFGPDGYLYITTGDASDADRAQERESLAGKILRLRDDGSIPADNPFGNAVYSYGHRNPQGLAWDDRGRLWSTEHGRSGVLSGYDELNLITKGGNYGWPVIQGSETREGMIAPVLHSGPTTTWAPASASYHEGSIFFGGLRGEALYEAVLSEEAGGTPELRTHFKGKFGRIRTVRFGPDGFLYFTTSNTDGRGDAQANDDRVIRVDPAFLR